MKNILIPLLLLLTCQFSASAQWNNVWPNNNQYLMSGCYATGADTCYVAGYEGKIYHTFNGGATWDSSQTIFTSSWFNDIKFPTKTVGYACGGTAFGQHTSTIAKTTNGGLTWDSITSNTFDYEFYCMSVPDENTGFFAGQELVKTTDGGQTFTAVPVTTGSAMYTAIKFFTPDKGLLAIRGTDFTTNGPVVKIMRTEDGGATWAATFADSSAPGQLQKIIHAIAFRDQLNGCAVGENGRVLRTTDGGLTWNLTTITSDTFGLTDVSFIENSLTGYITAEKFQGMQTTGRIYKTTDGGVTWQLDFSTTQPMVSISAHNNGLFASSFQSVFKADVTSWAPENTTKKGSFVLYPNPARNAFYLDFSETLLQRSIAPLS